jgi:hypothetical protein
VWYNRWKLGGKMMENLVGVIPDAIRVKYKEETGSTFLYWRDADGSLKATKVKGNVLGGEY